MSAIQTRYKGVFPVVPTTFTESGDLDLESQKRCVDFMIDAGSNGICILANFSEQFVLSDEEREVLSTAILRHVAGRVPGNRDDDALQFADLCGAQSARPGRGSGHGDGNAAISWRDHPRS